MTMACPACDAAPLAVQTAAAGQADVILSVPGLHCAACIRKVEQCLMAHSKVRFARVNLSLKRVSVGTDLDDAELIEILAQNGYEAFALSAEILQESGDRIGRDLLWRMGLAGFAMMNVMLLSVAVWSGAADATRDLFHLISAAIAAPVVIVSGRPFFISAQTALRGGRLNMDVPISLAIFLATVVSLYEALHSGAHAYFDAALSLTFFLLIGRYLDHRSRATARSAAKELSALEHVNAKRLDEAGRAIETPVQQLEIGDKILIATGMRLPVDGTLKSPSAQLDRAFLTGESDVITAREGEELHSGEINLGSPFVIEATAVGEDTTLRKIAALVEIAETARNRYTALADRAAAIYAPAVHLLALAAFVGWAFISGDLRIALNVAIAVLIITCPCALGLAVPAVSTAAISKLYAKGYLVKSGSALERMAEVDTVVFDKTGTLTRPGFDPADIPSAEQGVLLALAQASQHPLAQALAKSLSGAIPAQLSDITETVGTGIEARFEGEIVRLGKGDWLGLDDTGFAYSIAGRAARLHKTEQLRPGALDAVNAVKARGLQVILLSGDTAGPAQEAGQHLGIEQVISQVTPDQKHQVLSQLKEQGHRVLMVGDGLNDAPSLAAAHASLAPASAIDAARSAADVVLTRDDIGTLADVLDIGKAARRISLQNFAIALAYNCIAVPVALVGLATPLIAALAMSSSSITVLLNALRVRKAKA